jgi:hypothetical protein
VRLGPLCPSDGPAAAGPSQATAGTRLAARRLTRRGEIAAQRPVTAIPSSVGNQSDRPALSRYAMERPAHHLPASDHPGRVMPSFHDGP